MRKTIWILWLQGESNAPEVVKHCIRSWRNNNPSWEVRCLDAASIRTFVDLRWVDPSNLDISPASFSDVVRILLLHEYGGVWADATTFCNRPLDSWLPEAMSSGFFAFARPGPDRELSSWFLAANPNHPLVEAWADATLRFWRSNKSAKEYFWFHYLFPKVLDSDARLSALWNDTPKIEADPCHIIQKLGMESEAIDTVPLVDWTTPVFKLNFRHDAEAMRPGRLLYYLLHKDLNVPKHSRNKFWTGRGLLALMSRWVSRIGGGGKEISPRTHLSDATDGREFASLKVSTDNLGDHVQIIACNDLLRRFGIRPSIWIDRDHEIKSTPSIPPNRGRTPLVINGWFKRNGKEWPPNEKTLKSLIIGFHIRPYQCPELVSPMSIAYLKRHQPIGCRDIYSAETLSAKGVATYLSGCLSLSFARRLPVEMDANTTFVVSRDTRLLEALPPDRGPYVYINQYSGDEDFEANMVRAGNLLQEYKKHAKLIVTTMLHCALPALAMGIPVVCFYPDNTEEGHQSDMERFSLLAQLQPIHMMSAMHEVDWSPAPPDLADIKLGLVDRIASFVDSTVGKARTPFQFPMLNTKDN